MADLTDCPSCGGLVPAGQRCCPHCHCKYPLLKRWRLLVAAALGLGAAGCDHHPMPEPLYGPVQLDLGGHDLAAPDAGPDLAPTDGGTD